MLLWLLLGFNYSLGLANLGHNTAEDRKALAYLLEAGPVRNLGHCGIAARE